MLWSAVCGSVGRRSLRRFARRRTLLWRAGRVWLRLPAWRSAVARGVAEAFGFVAGGEVQELFERAGCGVHVGVRVADGGEARGHGEDGEVGGVAGRGPRPRRAARRRGRRAAGGRSRRRRWCGPWRSGCSRGRRRGAPPSTTWSWRALGTRRSTARARARAARRTSVKVQRGWMRTLMCMPREPLVLGQPSRPCSSRTALTSSATGGRRPRRRRGWGRGRRGARRGGRDRRSGRGADGARCSRG